MSASTSPSLIVLAFLAFFSTTLDDFAVVLVFLGKEFVKTHDVSNPVTRDALISIIIGQVLGFSLIVGIALGIGVGLRETIKEGVIDLIGFLPILLGIYKIYEVLHEDKYFDAMCTCMGCTKAIDEDIEEKGESGPLIVKNESSQEEAKANTDGDKLKEPSYISLAEKSDSKRNQNYGADGSTDKERDDGVAEEESSDSLQESTDLLPKNNTCCLCNSLIQEVAMYALMFGVDNIAIYVSLLSNLSNEEIAGAIVIFYSLLSLYLIIAVLIITKVSIFQDLFILDSHEKLMVVIEISVAPHVRQLLSIFFIKNFSLFFH